MRAIVKDGTFRFYPDWTLKLEGKGSRFAARKRRLQAFGLTNEKEGYVLSAKLPLREHISAEI
jgi:hypothetical protein